MTAHNKSPASVFAGLVLLGSAGMAQAAITTPAVGPFTKVGAAQPMAPGAAAGGALVIDLAGTPSTDALEEAPNVRWVLDVAPGALVDAVGYQLTLSTVDESWLSEASVLITNSAGQGVRFTPGFASEVKGTASFGGSASLLALNDALGQLASTSLRLAQVVECRYFAGYDDAETALALNISERTVRRDWTLARAWLHRELADTK